MGDGIWYMDILKPQITANSLNDINLKSYWEMGKRGIIIDLDNTITPWNVEKVNLPAHNFLIEARSLNYKICLLTNAGQKRAEKIAQRYQMHYIAPAFKPAKGSFVKALKLMHLQKEQVLVIGDQIFTDILGGNRIGCFTILVPAISKREFIGTKILRLLERVINWQ